MWEDDSNTDGGEWFYRGYLPLGDLDMFWEDTILGIIGETLDPNADEVCGCRIIDKSRVNSGKAHIRPAYRLELWFKTSTDHALREDIKQRGFVRRMAQNVARSSRESAFLWIMNRLKCRLLTRWLLAHVCRSSIAHEDIPSRGLHVTL